MGLVGAIIGVMGIAKAATSLSSGYAANAEAEYNAVVLNQQAKQIEEQKKLDSMKYDRLKRQYSGAIVSRTAASGLELSGSPLAVLLDTQTQIEMDRATSQYNLELEKRYKMSQADITRQRGKSAIRSGYMGAFTSLLTTGAYLTGPSLTPKVTSSGGMFGTYKKLTPSTSWSGLG